MGQHKHDQLSKVSISTHYYRECIIPGQQTAWAVCSPPPLSPSEINFLSLWKEHSPFHYSITQDQRGKEWGCKRRRKREKKL